MLSSARPARHAVMGAIGAGALAGAMLFGAAAVSTAPAANASTAGSAPMHGRRTGARNVGRYVRHVELPNPPPQRERLFHQPQRPTQGSDQRSGTDLSQRRSPSSGRASDHPATLGRLPPTLWGSGDPLTVFGGAVCGARQYGRRGNLLLALLGPVAVRVQAAVPVVPGVVASAAGGDDAP